MAHLNIQRFRLQTGTDAEFIAGSRAFDAMVPTIAGLQSREVARSDEGEWIIVTRWQSVEAEELALGKLRQAGPPPFMAHIDQSTVSGARYTVDSLTLNPQAT